MITLQQAVSGVLEFSQPKGFTEVVPLWDSVGRILATDISSDINMPPFNKSAVDGYACRRADLHSDMDVVDVIAAGKFPQKSIVAGTCSKIMTGAPVPEGADCVFMVEDSQIVSEGKVRFTGSDTKTNIARFAEDVKVGEKVLDKGTLIEPQHIAILAAVGVSRVDVAVKPKVSVLITGDELVETDVKPTLSQIRNSNGHQLVTQVLRVGAVPVYGGIVDDTHEATRNAIANALETSDIVVLTGGVSMGDFDYVPGVLKDLGVDIKFQTIAVQPGKPTVFGVKAEKLVFGLPGNPVSSFFQFNILVRTAILALMGAKNPVKQFIKMPLANDYKRKRSERLALVPAFVNSKGEVEPINYHGSAHIFALANATSIIVIPIGVGEVKKGELVDVRPL